MSVTQTNYEHVELNENAQAVIAGTTFKIVELIEEKIADGASAEDLHLQHPNLTLGQIHSALAYYYDHKIEIDTLIQARLEHYEQSRAATNNSKFANRVRESGLL